MPPKSSPPKMKTMELSPRPRWVGWPLNAGCETADGCFAMSATGDCWACSCWASICWAISCCRCRACSCWACSDCDGVAGAGAVDWCRLSSWDVRVGSAWLERLASRNIILLGVGMVGCVEKAQVINRREANVFQLESKVDVKTPKPALWPFYRRSSACRANC
jgi:hypothetical protein